jgi:hypothetical protein
MFGQQLAHSINLEHERISNIVGPEVAKEIMDKRWGPGAESVDTSVDVISAYLKAVSWLPSKLTNSIQSSGWMPRGVLLYRESQRGQEVAVVPKELEGTLKELLLGGRRQLAKVGLPSTYKGGDCEYHL